MTKVPNGWTTTTLGQLAEYITSGSRDWSKYYAANGALFVRTQDINTNKLAKLENIARVSLPAKVEGKRSLIRQDDLLVTITGANVGRCAHVESEIPEAYVSQSVALIRLKNPKIAKFLHAQLLAPLATGTKTWLEENSYGIGRPVLSLENIRNVPINIAPIPEQERIVSTLGIAEAHVKTCRDRLARIVPILKDFRRSVLEAATSGRLTADWRELQSQHESGNELHDLLKTDHEMAGGDSRSNSAVLTEGAQSLRIEDLPGSWDITELKDACSVGRPIPYGICKARGGKSQANENFIWQSSTVGDLIQGIEAGLNVKCEERPPGSNEFGLVKISAVTWGRFNEDESKTLAPNAEVSPRARIRPGDFLISRANTVELVGACVLVENVTRELYLSDKVLRLVMPDYLKPWLLYVLRSPVGRRQIETLASGNQLSMRNLSQLNLKSINVPLPSKEEIGEIVRRVKTLLAFADRMEARISTALSFTEQLTPALLAKAFRGELVAQDPNDEDAFELLKRLVTGRDASADKPERRERAGRSGQDKPAFK
jgi:restriction endonuclease S subunit